MNRNDSGYGWIGWAAAIGIGITFIFYIFSSNSTDSTSTIPEPAPTSSLPIAETIKEEKSSQNNLYWHCIDATTYNQNAYDDNKCTKGTEVQYVSDSQAVALDPTYSPGKAGASYYNNQ